MLKNKIFIPQKFGNKFLINKLQTEFEVQVKVLIGQFFQTKNNMSDYQVVRYKKNKCNFEILVKPLTVLKYKEGKIKMEDVIYSDTIFSNFQKGDKAKLEELQFHLKKLILQEQNLVKKTLKKNI
jgi:hypothetical protein